MKETCVKELWHWAQDEKAAVVVPGTTALAEMTGSGTEAEQHTIKREPAQNLHSMKTSNSGVFSLILCVAFSQALHR